MLTSRGWWLLLADATALSLGGVLTLSVRNSPTLLFVALAVLLWFAWEGVLFLYQARVLARSLLLTRTLRDGQAVVKTVWAGRPFTVELALTLPNDRTLPLVHATDWPPAGLDVSEADRSYSGVIPATWQYAGRAGLPGELRFLGVRVHLADRQGFFHWSTFLHVPVTAAVLPKLADAEANQRSRKRVNRLPPPGVHRFRSPGTGSELLELRDYQPGDPPRRIAWKVSARRDRLITREYESEVPLRLTTIIDAGGSARRGGTGRPLDRFLLVAGSLAQAAANNRDLFGLSIVSDDNSVHVTPARGGSHLVRCLRRLSAANVGGDSGTGGDVTALQAWATAVAFEVYPELIRPETNGVPFWLPWLAPPRGPRGLWPTVRRILQPFKMIPPAQRRQFVGRKQLAALLTALHRLPPGDVGRLMEDDSHFARQLRRFLHDHGIPLPPTRPDAPDPAAPRRVQQLANALTRSVAGGRDNELFVLLADLPGLDADWTPLLKAARVARARHHQLLVLAPGPLVALPAEPGPDAAIIELTRYATARRVAVPQQRAKERFGKLAIPVIFADAGESARAVMQRLDRMRAVQGAIRT